MQLNNVHSLNMVNHCDKYRTLLTISPINQASITLSYEIFVDITNCIELIVKCACMVIYYLSFHLGPKIKLYNLLSWCHCCHCWILINSMNLTDAINAWIFHLCVSPSIASHIQCVSLLRRSRSMLWFQIGIQFHLILLKS